MGQLSYMKKAADATGASLPPISIESLPASEKHTLRGMTPPVSYTRVNASSAPQPDAGAMQQKSQPPMGMMALPKQAHVFSGEDANMNMTARPLIQDLVKSAMDRSVQRAKIAEEGARQMRKADGEEDDKEKDSCGPGMKTASDESVSTEYAHKLAGAVEYISQHLKTASSAAHISETVQHPPEGVMQTSSSGQLPGPGGYGKAHHQPPTNPGTQKALPQEHGGTQMQNTLGEHVPGTQQTAMSGGKGKTASLAAKNVAVLSKVAGKKVASPAMQKKEASSALVDAFLTTVKKAADENNPAQISAGKAVPPDTSAAGESGGAPVAGMPQGPRGLVHSNESAINYKKNQAYSPRKAELKAYLSEPALTSSTDSTLQAAFAHTGEAGTKMASAQQADKVAAARALLSKIAERTAAK